MTTSTKKIQAIKYNSDRNRRCQVTVDFCWRPTGLVDLKKGSFRLPLSVPFMIKQYEKGKGEKSPDPQKEKEKTGIRVPKADNDVRPSNPPITFLALRANTRGMFLALGFCWI